MVYVGGKISISSQSFVTMVVRSSSISFPSGNTHTHTQRQTVINSVNGDIILLRHEYLLKQFWTDSEFWSVRYANPATSSVPKKPPITQPMSMKKLVPLSTCESQSWVLNWSSNAFLYLSLATSKSSGGKLGFFTLSIYHEHAGRQKVLLYSLAPDRWLLCRYQRKTFLWGSTSPSTHHFLHCSYHKAPGEQTQDEEDRFLGKWSPSGLSAAHPGHIFHFAVRAGEAVAAMCAIEMECDVWRGLWYAAAKHRRFSHSNGDIFRMGEVTQTTGAWCWSGVCVCVCVR